MKFVDVTEALSVEEIVVLERSGRVVPRVVVETVVVVNWFPVMEDVVVVNPVDFVKPLVVAVTEVVLVMKFVDVAEALSVEEIVVLERFGRVVLRVVVETKVTDEVITVERVASTA
jgi:hypothetical protein